jgi:hypothetical protein
MYEDPPAKAYASAGNAPVEACSIAETVYWLKSLPLPGEEPVEYPLVEAGADSEPETPQQTNIPGESKAESSDKEDAGHAKKLED